MSEAPGTQFCMVSSASTVSRFRRANRACSRASASARVPCRFSMASKMAWCCSWPITNISDALGSLDRAKTSRRSAPRSFLSCLYDLLRWSGGRAVPAAAVGAGADYHIARARHVEENSPQLAGNIASAAFCSHSGYYSSASGHPGREKQIQEPITASLAWERTSQWGGPLSCSQHSCRRLVSWQ
jgi:hypothetical protein